MAEKEKFAIGDRVEQVCVTCGEERGHIVASVAKSGRVTRVTCAVCSTRSAYKPSVQTDATRAPAKTGTPYDQKHTYRRGQTLMHPTLGVGQVTAVIEPRKIDVLFADKVRRLIHADA